MPMKLLPPGGGALQCNMDMGVGLRLMILPKPEAFGKNTARGNTVSKNDEGSEKPN